MTGAAPVGTDRDLYPDPGLDPDLDLGGEPHPVEDIERLPILSTDPLPSRPPGQECDFRVLAGEGGCSLLTDPLLLPRPPGQECDSRVLAGEGGCGCGGVAAVAAAGRYAATA